MLSRRRIVGIKNVVVRKKELCDSILLVDSDYLMCQHIDISKNWMPMTFCTKRTFPGTDVVLTLNTMNLAFVMLRKELFIPVQCRHINDIPINLHNLAHSRPMSNDRGMRHIRNSTIYPCGP